VDAWCTWNERRWRLEVREWEPDGKESVAQWATSRRSSSDSATARSSEVFNRHCGEPVGLRHLEGGGCPFYVVDFDVRWLPG
jgi:hypothetical protein